MRYRLFTLFLVVSVLSGGGLVGVAAQGATPDAADVHPLVGTWIVDADADDPANAPEVDRFSADGGFLAVDSVGSSILGIWEATGERTAVSTFVSTGEDEDGGFAGTFLVRAAIEVDASGDAFTAEYTFELTGPDGSGSGEFGPGRAAGIRVEAEGPGTPIGPISALFGEEDAGADGEGTPAP